MILTLIGCYHENELQPSHFDENWYILQDSDDPLDHQRFLIYKETGIPIFYNDTIGKQNRGVDAFGEPVIYYEILHPDYTITSMTRISTYELSNQRDDLLTGVNFINDRIIPELISPLMYPRCFLLVKKLTRSSAGTYEADCFQGMMTTLVSHVEELKDMSESELHRLAMQIVGEQIGSYLADSCREELEEFYNIGRKEINPNASIYNFRLTASSEPPMAPVENYGFLSINKLEINNAYSCVTIAEKRDVMDYVTEIYINDDTAFREKYKDYPYVLKKFDIMKEIITDMKTRLK